MTKKLQNHNPIMKYYAGRGQDGLDKHLISLFKNKGVALEAGALDGITLSVTKVFEEFLGWQTINVEPVTYNFQKLIKNRPNSINLQYAFSSENKPLFIHRKVGKEKLSRITTEQNSNTHEIQGITYKSLIDKLNTQYNINGINLFVLDVEGQEIETIKGMSNALFYPDVFCIEIHFNSKDERNTKQKIIQNLLKQYTLCSYKVVQSFGYNTIFQKESQ